MQYYLNNSASASAGYFCVKSVSNTTSRFFCFLSDTDEYRPPVWKSYCKYLSIWGFFSKSELEKFQLYSLKDSFLLSSEREFKKPQGVHFCLEIGAVELPSRTSEHRLFGGVDSLPLINISCPTPGWSHSSLSA